ncbi:long-chain-fatty-acid--CoA ligase [Pallidibacillus pasinlerensis]|uniref:Long-chain-fatty-acid--CoA ligase n=1 Tax=Pallidibacillus pasinlerensis TaxID=2703818 RepID=A0ABX0A0V3_9BACI|nr:long-chain-fatty-acid--CoA ligase [Pallidibacillus pasinlerensis]NCU17041.1 long-chain-fatty-acid--CoA ligase [Pallidibacillus pasinlerensis]
MENKPWLQHYPDAIPKTIEIEEKSLQQFLVETAKKYPTKVALHFNGKEMTYQEVYESALKFANYLKSIGIQKGDRVAIMLPNTPQSFISFFGVLLAGGIIVQTNPMYTEREVAYQMKDSGAKAIIALDILYPRITKVQNETDLEHIIITAIKDYLPFPKNLIYPFIQKKQYGFSVKVEHGGNIHLFTEIMKAPPLEDPILDVNFDEDLAILQYTGGTTGFPKGVMLTHKNLVANAKMCETWLYKCEEGKEVVLGALPFFHVYGMTTVLILSVLQGSKVVLIPKPEPEVLLKAIQSQKVTMFPGAPTMYIGLLNHPDLQKYDLSSIDSCISGSATLPVEVQEQFENLTGGKLVEGYGLTEASPVTHANLLWDGERIKGSIGIPWPNTLAEIRDLETDEPLPPGEVGELVVKGPQVMKGYWNRPEDTEETLRDGWLYTGDLGYMDEKGYFYIVDRKKDMIIASGFNIYPREIEEVLYEHPAVQEAVVAGIPDPYRGETVKAYIVLKEDHSVTEKEMDKFARKHLAAYKVPRLYEFRDELPKTTVGKILRRQLVEEERKKLEQQTDEKQA